MDTLFPGAMWADSSVSSRVLHALFLATLQATLLLVVALVVTSLMRRASAAQRHLVWSLALGSVLVWPLLGAAIPYRIPLRTSVAPLPATSFSKMSAERGTFASATSVSTGVMPQSVGPSGAEVWSQNSLQNFAAQLEASRSLIVAGIWLAGGLLLAMRLGRGVRQLRRLERESAPLQSEAWSAVVRETALLLPLRRAVSIRIAQSEDAATVPLTWGWRRPIILLPLDAPTWDASKQRAVLLHERAHIVRGDWAALWLAQVVRALLWFHPLVWIAARAVRIEGERATDDYVLLLGVRASEYAECLMEFTTALASRSRLAPAMSIGMAHSSTLGKRLVFLLDASRSRRRPTRAQALGSALATLLLLASASSFTLADEIAPPKSKVAAIPIRGRVVDADGKPVAGAKIELYPLSSNDSPPLQTTQSDAQGEYQVNVPDKADSYSLLQIEKAGFGVKVGYVTAADAKKSKPWTLVAPTSLSGTVTDENDVPVRGARVAVHGFTENRFFVGQVHGIETRTDAEGKWTLRRLPVGVSSEFEIVVPGFARGHFNALLEANPAPFPPVKLQPGFDATGRVVDVAGKPLAGAQVSLRNGGYASAQTDRNGQFTLQSLPLTEQELTVSSEQTNQFAPGGVRVSPTQPSTEIRLQRGIPMRGRVLSAQTRAPLEGVLVADQMRRSGGALIRTDAQGRFQITLASEENASLVFEAPSHQTPVFFFSSDQKATRDAGDILLQSATIWRGKVRIAGKAPGEPVYLNLRSAGGSAQLASDEAGNFQINSLPPGDYHWTDDKWNWKPLSPLQISVPAPKNGTPNAPFVLDVNVERIAKVSARGRVVNSKGGPLPYALVTLQSDTSTPTVITRSDGTWQRDDISPTQKLAIKSVTYGETTVQNPDVPAQKIGGKWQFAAATLNDQAGQIRIKVVDEGGKIAPGARVLALWGRESRFALADQKGVASFKLAPQKVRFLAARGLNFGETTLEGSLFQATIQLQAPQNPLPRAEAVALRLIDRVDQTANAERLGDERWREFALKADGATADWDRAGDNFGKYLSSLTYRDPAAALEKAPAWLGQIQRPETERPFFLRLAEAEFALLGAKSKNQTARAWAAQWLNRQIANFSAPVQLKPGWAGGDRVSRYLQGYAVATQLGRREASSFFDAALNALPGEQKNPGSYSFPEYFTLDDPNAEVFRAELVPGDRVNFQGALSSNAIRRNSASASAASAALEKLLAQLDETEVGVDAIRFARRRVAAEILGAQIKSEAPRVAFQKLRAFDTSAYNIGTFALSLARRALKGGDETLAREVLEFATTKGWPDQEIQTDDWDELKARLLPVATPSQIEELRSRAIAHFKNGDPMRGNQAPDIGADSKALRTTDPALGRLILEAKWSSFGSWKSDPRMDNRFQASALATTMGQYDPMRALNWFEQIPRGGEVDPTSNELDLAERILGAARKKATTTDAD